MSSILKPENLAFWIRNDLNVLMEGKHGVGKTTQIIEAFEEANLKWRYFSAATLDPWVDLIGVPKEVKDSNGQSFLDLIRPKEFQYDQVEALFFDEFNRAHKKVRNACMELIQFKSINGKKLNNLKIVWCAVNPDDEEEYDVEKLDLAQEDRFQIQIQVPYKVSSPYFVSKYGDEIAKSAMSWWNELQNDKNVPQAIKNKVSPRRLDYALHVWSLNGELEWVLPDASNILKLKQTIKVGPISAKLEKLFKAKDTSGAKKFLEDENTVVFAIDWLSDNFKSKSKNSFKMDFFLPLMPTERISQMATDQDICSYMMNKSTEKWSGAVIYARILNEIVNADVNKTIVKFIKNHAKKNPNFAVLLDESPAILKAAESDFGVKPQNPYSPKRGYNSNYSEWLKSTKTGNVWSSWFSNTVQKTKFLAEIQKQIPPNLNVADALETLDFLQAIASSSHTNSLESKDEFKPFMPLLNYVIQEISKGTKKDWIGIRDSFFKKRFARLYEKIGSSKALAGRLLCPVGSNKIQDDDSFMKALHGMN